MRVPTSVWRRWAAAGPAVVVACALGQADPQADPPADQPAGEADQQGGFDASGFLSSPAGVLPLAMPITEPAVGLGLGVGLSFFHGKPTEVASEDGGPARVIMPSTTVLFGAGTENGTWAAGVGHLGVWDEGRVHYQGVVGYASLDLDWYGRGEQLGDRGIGYDNEMLIFDQRVRFQLGDSGFSLGPRYTFLSSEARFDVSDLLPGEDLDIPTADFNSQTSGLGLTLSYDSLDQPFSPTRGFRAEATGAWFDRALGGDFDFGMAAVTGIGYIPLEERVVLGLRGDFSANGEDAPFYQLSALNIRGLERGRYVDDMAMSLQAELRVDFTERWTALGFGGAGRVGSSLDDIIEQSDHWGGGVGLRYLLASEYGLRVGADVAYGDGEAKLYISVGTGWIRP